MGNKKDTNKNMTAMAIVALIILFGIGIRSYYVIKDPELIGLDSYYHYRIAGYFSDNNRIPAYDDKYYGGREHPYPPLFHILLGSLGKIMPLITASKAIPIILAGIYLCFCCLIFRKPLPVFLLATMPVLLYKQGGYLLTDGLVLVYLSILIYSIQKRNLWLYGSVFLLYSLTHTSAIAFSVIFFLASLLLVLAGRGVKNGSKGYRGYCFMGLSLIPLLVIPVFFSNALSNGPAYFPLDITSQLFSMNPFDYFILKEMNPAIFAGLIIFAVYLFSDGIHRLKSRFSAGKSKKNKKNRFKMPEVDTTYLILSLPLLLVPLRIITFHRALAYSAIPLVYFASTGIGRLNSRIRTRYLWNIFLAAIIITCILSSYLAIKELSWAVVDKDERSGLDFLKEGCKGGLGKNVLSYNFNHRISAQGCTVFFDEIYTIDSTRRYRVMQEIYSSNSKDSVLDAIKENNITAIVVYSQTAEKFPQFPGRAEDYPFLKEIFRNDKMTIYGIEDEMR